MKKPNLFFILLLIFISACSSQPTSTPTPLPSTSTPTITLSPTQTATITITPTLTPTITRTPISEEERQELLQTYMAMLLVEVNTNLLKETAERVNTGELTGFEKVGVLIGVATLIEAVEQSITEIDVPSKFDSHWKDTIGIHEITKDLVARWFNSEIDSTMILEEIDSHIEDISTVMDNLDRDMASEYGFDSEELGQARQEAMQSMNEIFETPTPTLEE